MTKTPSIAIRTDEPVSNLVQFSATVGLYSLAYLLSLTSPYYIQLLAGRPINFAPLNPVLARIATDITSLIGSTPADFIHTVYYAAIAFALYKYAVLYRSGGAPLSRPYKFCYACWKIAKNNLVFLRHRNPEVPKGPALTKDDLTNLLYFAVKFFFLPLMALFIFSNLGALVHDVQTFPITLAGRYAHQSLYILPVDMILFVDVSFFLIGYLFEFKGKSEIRSVEPTAFGWFVTLLCYPPFNGVVANYLPFTIPNVSFFFGSQLATDVFLALAAILYLIYGLATVALNLKSSNLTNRGIVSWGPYSVIRHPAYTCKNLAWVTLSIPALATGNIGAFITVAVWVTIYGLRALTEERHLLQDPDYVDYCKKVPYRFIPGVY